MQVLKRSCVPGKTLLFGRRKFSSLGSLKSSGFGSSMGLQRSLLSSPRLPYHPKVQHAQRVPLYSFASSARLASTASHTQSPPPAPDVYSLCDSLDDLARPARDPTRIPTEAEVEEVLRRCLLVAQQLKPRINENLLHTTNTTPSFSLFTEKSASPLPKSSQTTQTQKQSQQRHQDQTIQQLVYRTSNTAWSVLAEDNVIITPDLLELYVDVQTLLQRPDTIPSIFEMYASKPQPDASKSTSTTIVYTKPNPKRAACAIEPELAQRALVATLAAKDLNAAVGVIESSVATPAFQRQKILRALQLPGFLLVGTPVAVYTLASTFSRWHATQLDPTTATAVAFTAMLAYTTFVVSIGTIARLTASDHMKRVTWLPGKPMRWRWVREEERAAYDKVACAWGFNEPWRYGEETGVEWDSLREFIGQKGMILDRVDLMPGMND